MSSSTPEVINWKEVVDSPSQSSSLATDERYAEYEEIRQLVAKMDRAAADLLIALHFISTRKGKAAMGVEATSPKRRTL